MDLLCIKRMDTRNFDFEIFQDETMISTSKNFKSKLRVSISKRNPLLELDVVSLAEVLLDSDSACLTLQVELMSQGIHVGQFRHEIASLPAAMLRLHAKICKQNHIYHLVMTEGCMSLRIKIVKLEYF